MKRIALALCLCLVAVPLPATAQRKGCEELKTEIEAKIKANGVAAFTLEVAAADQVKDEKVVGSCDGGTKKIVYKRGDAPAKKDEPAKKS
jgi:hypothetical protein